MGEPEARGMPLKIYDLDGVLTRRDTFTELLLARLRAAPHRLLRVVPQTLAMPLPAESPRRARAIARIVELALHGLDDEGYSALAARIGERVGADPDWMRAETIDRIRRQRAEGARIVIATATEQRLAEALLARAGVPYDALSASRLEPAPTGMRLADHRIGARKAQALREAGVPIGTAEFVTDSATDLPTARLAASVVLIGASPRTVRRFARAGVPCSV